MKVEITIDGEPMGKQRPRHNKWTTYTPQKTKDYERKVATLYMDKYPDFKFADDTTLKMTVKAYMAIPKSTSKKKFIDMLSDAILPNKKPDWDNIGKIVSDGLNSVAYGDDKQICIAIVEKHYSDNPRTEVTIEESNRHS